MTGSAKSIPSTNVSAELGQMNSVYTDNRFGISQAISFPTVYKRQKSLLEKEAQLAGLRVSWSESELKKSVSLVYYELITLHLRERLLSKSDSLYREFSRRTAIRYKVGESDVLEKATAENQKNAIELQLKDLRSEQYDRLLYFNLLLNSINDYQPDVNNGKLAELAQKGVQALANNPKMAILESSLALSKRNTALEKSKLLPDLSFGYFTTTMRGIGADDLFYGANKRFHAAQIGLSIPIFTAAQHARINAARINEDVALSDLQRQKQELQLRFSKLLEQYSQKREGLLSYQNVALPNSRLIISTAGKQFASGEINYLNWVILINQAIAIESSYLELIRSLNEVIVELNYLTPKQS